MRNRLIVCLCHHPAKECQLRDCRLKRGSTRSRLPRVLLLVLLLTNSVIVFTDQSSSGRADIKKRQMEDFKPKVQSITSYLAHSSIVISSDADFSAQGFSGSGTMGDPFVIEGYNITTATEPCISVSDTNVYFVIRDCLLTGVIGAPRDFPGIIFDNVTHGEIRNNTIQRRHDGVYLRSSSENTILDNRVSMNFCCGFNLSTSSSNIVRNNSLNESIVGMFLSSSSDNLLVNNSITLSYSRDVWFEESMSNVLENNTISSEGASYNIYLRSSSMNVLVNNSISGSYSDSSVLIRDSTQNTIVENTMSGSDIAAIRLVESPHNTLSRNEMLDDGIAIEGSVVEYWQQDITADNLVHEKLLGYFFDKENLTVDGTRYGQILLINCSSVSVRGGAFKDVPCGVVLAYSSGCSLRNTSVSDSFWAGVHLRSSKGNTLVTNSISSNIYGIELISSCNNTFLNNIIWENTQIGVSCGTGSDHNLFYLNAIARNEQMNARDNGYDNRWNTSGVGNFWNDYSGSGEYDIPGAAGSVDYHPSRYYYHVPVWVDIDPPEIESTAAIEFPVSSTGQTITWVCSDAYPSHFEVYRNGTQVMSESWSGDNITVGLENLSVGLHDYTIVVYDLCENWNSDTVLVHVLPQMTSETTAETPSDMSVVLFLGVGVVGIVTVLILVRHRANR